MTRRDVVAMARRLMWRAEDLAGPLAKYMVGVCILGLFYALILFTWTAGRMP